MAHTTAANYNLMRLAVRLLPAVVTLFISGCAVGQVGDIPFTAYIDPADTTIRVYDEDEERRIDITSESGIGKAEFQFYATALPDDLTFRLHLSGLENLTYSTADFTVRASATSHGDHAIMQSVVVDDEEQLIDADSPYWLTITFVTTAGEQIAYFDVHPPAIVAQDSSVRITLSWIDFYR